MGATRRQNLDTEGQGGLTCHDNVDGLGTARIPQADGVIRVTVRVSALDDKCWVSEQT